MVGICIWLCYKFPTESNIERILKIGQHLVKLWARVRCLVFLTHGVVYLYGVKITDNNKKLCYRKRTARRAMSVEISCTTFCANQLHHKSTASRMELESYSWRTCCKQPRRVGHRRCRQQAPSSTSFVDNAIDLPRGNFLSPEFWTKVRSEVPVLGQYPIPEFPYNTV